VALCRTSAVTQARPAWRLLNPRSRCVGRCMGRACGRMSQLGVIRKLRARVCFHPAIA